ncbi:hypothetical protein PHACT_12560 [Pseudohongiella acticola]|uniref:Uncharacterized protein n=1 Tax=Pseudohongiella acticola TaxID=1524254 RepID=A0A1E8CG43_9GAMM|nr:hypothetical protein [Pseudohongiella acticola]OFE11383.1 hypothetical protein PHACT_12560 [Pseudohongiella acticola]
MAAKHIYQAGDPQSRRVEEVRVNGVPVPKVIYADTRRGVVRAFRDPFQTDKHGKRALTRTLRGNVEVTLRD